MEKKILVLTSSFPRWKNDIIGGGNFVYELAKETSREFRIFMVAPYAEGASKFEIIDNIHIYRFKQTIFGNYNISTGAGMLPNIIKNKFLILQLPFYFLFQLIKAVKLIREEKITIVHAHWIIPQGLTAVLLKLLSFRGFSLLTTVHGGDIWSFRGRIGKSLKKFILKKSDLITVVSKEIKEEILKMGCTNKIFVHPMGVTTDEFVNEKKDIALRQKFDIDGFFLLFVGSLIEKKGVEYLIKALPKVIEKFQNTKLIVIGMGTLENNLRKLTTELNMEKNIFFAGALNHNLIAPYFATADIFIGPSIVAASGDAEGFGLVFAEAASCETYVITTDFPAIADIIKDGETGFTVAQKDSKALAEKIIYVLDNFDKLDHIRKNARKHVVENFDWKIVGENYSTLYKNLLNETR